MCIIDSRLLFYYYIFFCSLVNSDYCYSMLDFPRPAKLSAPQRNSCVEIFRGHIMNGISYQLIRHPSLDKIRILIKLNPHPFNNWWAMSEHNILYIIYLSNISHSFISSWLKRKPLPFRSNNDKLLFSLLVLWGQTETFSSGRLVWFLFSKTNNVPIPRIFVCKLSRDLTSLACLFSLPGFPSLLVEFSLPHHRGSGRASPRLEVPKMKK